MQKEFTTITLVKGRRPQLANQFLGINRNTIFPKEHIVVVMDNDPIDLPHTDIPVQIVRITNKSKLPLALARNEGWRHASTENIIFLDVDCIPAPTLFNTLLANINESTIVTAYPRYLENVPSHPWVYTRLYSSSVEHPGRKFIPYGTPVKPELFWSLVFACKLQTLKKINGFDENYTGYGAEDTDFALSADKHNIDLMFVNETVLHQYHDKYDPPLQHFNDILENASYFYKKWSIWPMEGWLKAFKEMNLIKIHSDRIEILASPTIEMLKNAHSTLPY